MNLINQQGRSCVYLNSGLPKEKDGITKATRLLSHTRKNQWKPALLITTEFFGFLCIMQKVLFPSWLIHFTTIPKLPIRRLSILPFFTAVRREKILSMCH